MIIAVVSSIVTYTELAMHPYDRAIRLAQTLVKLEALSAIQLLEVSCAVKSNKGTFLKQDPESA